MASGDVYEAAFKLAEDGYRAEKASKWADAKFFFEAAAEAFMAIMAAETDEAKVKVLHKEIGGLLEVWFRRSQ